MVRLTRLKIDRFRNVKPGRDLRFGPTFNVLLGKNATGKSTLLDLVAAVTNDDLSAYAAEDAGFDLTWWMQKGEDEVEVHAVRTPAKFGASSEPLRQEREFDDAWAIALQSAGLDVVRLEVTGTRGTCTFDGEPPESFDVRTGLASRGAGLRALRAAFDKHLIKTPVPRRLPEWFKMFPIVHRGGRFDEALVTLDAITGSEFTLSRIGEREWTGWFGPWLPADFMHIAKEPASQAALVVPLGELAALSKVPALLGFAFADLRPRLLDRSHDGDSVTARYKGFYCLFRRADGSEISHGLLSFGQKRLFSFLWYLACREALPVIADELFNGLHHEWIEVCMDRLYDRQSFLATQHPYLLDHIPIESEAGVRSIFIRCTIERDAAGHDQMAWRNFDDDEADRFFTAYQTGIQHVSEVLRTEGLW